MSSRWVYAVAGLLILSAAYGCYCQAPLIWDGAYQFDVTLAQQFPYVYKSRFHTFFLWYPTVWASHVTSNVNVLQAIYGLPFLLAPVVGLLLSWWMVKKHAPHLIMWVIFGVAAATVPGQIFVINDSYFQLHLFWPLFVSVFVPLTWPKRIVLAILAVFQMVHPVGVLLLLGGAVAGGLVAYFDREHRKRLLTRSAVMLLLCGLAGFKIYLSNHIPSWIDDYAKQEATWANAWRCWVAAVWGTPLHGLVMMWGAAVLVFIQPIVRGRNRTLAMWCGVLAVVCVVRGASVWFYWAHGPKCLWGGAIDYRRWVGPLAVPFFLLATFEVIRRSRQASDPGAGASEPAGRIRGPVGVMVAMVFAITLGMQYTTFHQHTRLLMAAVRDYPRAIVPDTDPSLWFVNHSPLAHWGAGNYVTAMQGKTPEKMFLDATQEKIIRDKFFDGPQSEAERSAMGWWYYDRQPDQPPGPMGWFDFRPALARAKAEQHLPSRREKGKVLDGIP
ncbi:MAG: hypothetical protein JWN51_879 [Phycisphaerales bacterium]|nr:hypothetical protein [Phycisphaerales bacterium]